MLTCSLICQSKAQAKKEDFYLVMLSILVLNVDSVFFFFWKLTFCSYVMTFLSPTYDINTSPEGGMPLIWTHPSGCNPENHKMCTTFLVRIGVVAEIPTYSTMQMGCCTRCAPCKKNPKRWLGPYISQSGFHLIFIQNLQHINGYIQ